MRYAFFKEINSNRLDHIEIAKIERLTVINTTTIMPLIK